MNKLQTFFWLLRHGQFYLVRNENWAFGLGTNFNDGPLWYAHLGPFSIYLSDSFVRWAKEHHYL